MKSDIEKLKEYITNNPSCTDAFKNAKNRQELIEEIKKVAKQAGISLSDEDIKKYFSKQLSEEELDQVNGGWDICYNSNATSSSLC